MSQEGVDTVWFDKDKFTIYSEFIDSDIMDGMEIVIRQVVLNIPE